MIELCQRVHDYAKIRSNFNCLSDAELSKLIAHMDKSSGWGWSGKLNYQNQQFFVKGIPLTQIESENPWDTSNFFDLPMCYHYGVGSAGFGAYRELISQLKFSDFVVTGQCENFPLLYHARQITIPNETRIVKNLPESYFEYWNNNAQIRHYIHERNQAKSQLVLIMESFDFPLIDWLMSHQEETTELTEQLQTACDFLQDQQILHMDLHFKNVVYKDGLYALVDYGLVIDGGFTLASDEEAFLIDHYGYDLDQLYLSLAIEVWRAYQALPTDKKGEVKAVLALDFQASEITEFSSLIEKLNHPIISNLLDLKEPLINCINESKDRILSMFKFFNALRNDPNKAVRYRGQ